MPSHYGYDPNAYQVGVPGTGISAPAMPPRQQQPAPVAAPQQGFVGPPEPALTPSRRLATAISELSLNEQQKAESEAAYTRSQDMVKQLGSMSEIAPHWTGAVAAGIRGYLMRKEMKKGQQTGQKVLAHEAKSNEIKSRAELAQADQEHLRQLELEAMKAALRGDTDKMSEWEYNRDMSLIGQRIREKDATVTPLEKRRYEAWKTLQEQKNTRASLAGGLRPNVQGDIQSELLTNADQSQIAQDIRALATPQMFGVGSDVSGALTKVARYVGQDNWAGTTISSINEALTGRDPSEAGELLDSKTRLESSLYRLTNQILLQRSGAAVTAPEFERFKKEFPVGSFRTYEDFVVKMESFMANLLAERRAKIMSGQWVIRNGGVFDGNGEPIPLAVVGPSNPNVGSPAPAPASGVPDYESMSDEDLLGGG